MQQIDWNITRIGIWSRPRQQLWGGGEVHDDCCTNILSNWVVGMRLFRTTSVMYQGQNWCAPVEWSWSYSPTCNTSLHRVVGHIHWWFRIVDCHGRIHWRSPLQHHALSAANIHAWWTPMKEIGTLLTIFWWHYLSTMSAATSAAMRNESSSKSTKIRAERGNDFMCIGLNV